jgi:hypothetical protein
VPANAYGLASVTVDNYAAGTNTGSAASPFLTTVPDDNSLDISSGTTTGDLVRVTVTPAKAQKVSVVSTGAVKLIDEPTDTTNKYTAASGATSWTETAANVASPAALVFYAYTTSTTAGTFTVTVGDTGSTTYYLKAAEAGAPYKISATFPATVSPAGTGDIFAKVVDAFGNEITTGSTPITAEVNGAATLSTGADGYGDYDTTEKAWFYQITGATNAGQVAVSLSISATKVAAFGDVVASAFGVVNNASLAAQVTALTAQVATLQAQMADMRTKARSVTKKKYNTLARKWNRANPTDRVALKK